jgi:hypothetical protein
MRQITDHIFMLRPKHFGFNLQTAENNTFQHDDGAMSAAKIEEQALAEFDGLVSKLKQNGVRVKVLEDTDAPAKPDAIFPNNWFSTHQDGVLITYPMFSASRRSERREDLVELFSDQFTVSKHYSFEVYEEYEQYLEGTGSLVLDRVHRIAYACLSKRTDMSLVEKFCVVREFTPVTFHARYDNQPVYHTNVVMALGETYAVICMDSIEDSAECDRLKASFAQTHKEIIEITTDQMAAFAGNMIQLATVEGPVCVMSEQAYKALSKSQIERLGQHNRIVHAPIYTIEKYGGGSARCMIAENFLKPKPAITGTPES